MNKQEHNQDHITEVKTTDYFVAIHKELQKLEPQVVQLLENGWKLQGGITSVNQNNSWCFAQALYKD